MPDRRQAAVRPSGRQDVVINAQEQDFARKPEKAAGYRVIRELSHSLSHKLGGIVSRVVAGISLSIADNRPSSVFRHRKVARQAALLEFGQPVDRVGGANKVRDGVCCPCLI